MSKIYKHFKGGLYKLLYIATHSETQEKLVIYRSLRDNKIYARPYSMFFGYVAPGVKRFKLIKRNRTDERL